MHSQYNVTQNPLFTLSQMVRAYYSLDKDLEPMPLICGREISCERGQLNHFNKLKVKIGLPSQV